MIPNYSDPVVTLNEVYKAAQTGVAPILGACVIGPNYLVKTFEDLGEKLRLDSKVNYPTHDNNTYIPENGLPGRIIPELSNQEPEINQNSANAKVLVRNAEIIYREHESPAVTIELVQGVRQDSLKITSGGQNIIFKGVGLEDNTDPAEIGDKVLLTYKPNEQSTAQQIEASIVGFGKDEAGKFTECMISKDFPASGLITSVKFLKIKNAYLTADSFSITEPNTIGINPYAKVSIDLGLGLGLHDYPVLNGDFYFEYRIISNRFVKNYGLVSNLDLVEDLLGKICPDNPLGMAVASAVAESRGNFVYFAGITEPMAENSKLTELYLEAADLVGDKDGIYGIVPCTSDPEVIQALTGYVNTQSTERIPYPKYLYASADIPDKILIKQNINLDTVTSAGTVYTLTFGTNVLAELAINKGDMVEWGSSENQAEILETNYANIIKIKGQFSTAPNDGDSVSLYHIFKKKMDIIDYIIEHKPVSDKRVSLAFADGAIFRGYEVPNYCVAAALAGKRSGAYPHAPLSNVPMLAIITSDKHGFTASQSNLLGANGFWRVGLNQQGVCISRRQLTSAAAGDPNYDEQSIICDIDSIGSKLKMVGRNLVGNSNISPILLELLETTLKAQLDIFKIYVNDLIGPQLLDGSLLSIRQDPVHKDQIYAELNGIPPAPFNEFHITFYMV